MARRSGTRTRPPPAGLLAPTLGDWPLWAVPNSLREVEPTINLIIDEKDWSMEHPAGAPWRRYAAGPPT